MPNEITRLTHMQGQLYWTSIFLLAFGAAFFIVGVARLVELESFKFPKGKKVLFSFLHVLGCALFSASMMVFALDFHRERTMLVAILFFSAVLLLFPLQIYLGLLRKIRKP